MIDAISNYPDITYKKEKARNYRAFSFLCHL